MQFLHIQSEAWMHLCTYCLTQSQWTETTENNSYLCSFWGLSRFKSIIYSGPHPLSSASLANDPIFPLWLSIFWHHDEVSQTSQGSLIDFWKWLHIKNYNCRWADYFAIGPYNLAFKAGIDFLQRSHLLVSVQSNTKSTDGGHAKYHCFARSRLHKLFARTIRYLWKVIWLAIYCVSNHPQSFRDS